jgi:hypothetical protein
MSNPGPASTQTSNYLLNGSAADGVLIGIAGGEVGFYGETPVVQAGAISPLVSTTASTTDMCARINSIITALQNIGITA